MADVDFGKASRTTDIDWGKACKTCVDNKELIKQQYGVGYPMEEAASNWGGMAMWLTLAVMAAVIVYLFLKVRNLNNSVSISNGPLDAKVDTSIKKWLADCRIDEYADYMDGTIALEITKGGKIHADSKRTRGGASGADQ